MKRAIYDKQFKIAAVKMAQLEDKSVFDTAKELNVSVSSLRRWINEYDEYGESAFPGLEAHFSILNMKLRYCKNKMKSCGLRMNY